MMKKKNLGRNRIVLYPDTAPTHVRLSPDAGAVLLRLVRASGLSATRVVSQILVQVEPYVDIDSDQDEEEEEDDGCL